MEDGTLIVAILAFLVAWGGLVLGVVNHFHTRKSDKRASQISDEQDKLSFEQRKQEALNLLHQAEMAIIFCETHLDFNTSRETLKYPGLPTRKEELRDNNAKLRGFLEALRGQIMEPETTRIQLEEYLGRTTDLKATAQEVEATQREIYQAVMDANL